MTTPAASTAAGAPSPTAGELLHRPARTGGMYWGPGDQPPPDNIEEVAARYVEAAPRYGMEFLVA